MVAASSGTSVRGSTTSTSMPSLESSSAVSNAGMTREPMATNVTSLPSLFTSATPMGTTYSSSGTWPVARYSTLFSKKRTGLLERMAALSSPLAS